MGRGQAGKASGQDLGQRGDHCTPPSLHTERRDTDGEGKRERVREGAGTGEKEGGSQFTPKSFQVNEGWFVSKTDFSLPLFCTSVPIEVFTLVEDDDVLGVRQAERHLMTHQHPTPRHITS